MFDVSLTVVIPTYNRAPLVGQAIQSVLSQNCSELEIVVVDDSSTDDTKARVRAFNGPIRYVRQSRSGPGAARNLGWSVARGSYIAFLDSDDVWFPWTLKLYLRCIREFNMPSFIAGSPFWFTNNDVLGLVRERPLQANYYTDYIASAPEPIWLGASCMLVRRDCLARFEAFQMNGEDLDFALHLGEQRGFVWIREPFTFGYRRHPVTAVHNFQNTLCGMRHLISEERGARFPGGDLRKRERFKLITRAIRPIVLEAARRNLFRSALGLYWDTFLWHLRLRSWKFLVAAPVLIVAYLSDLFGRGRGEPASNGER
jgi:glycosyltransferase involved in cell wall biosynthesis